MINSHINSSSVISTISDVVICELDGGAALLDLRSGNYYSLNSTGKFVLDLIQSPKTFEEIVQNMFDAFEVPKDVLENDLMAIISSLSEQDLLKIEE